jgi:hypothetical protein
MVKKLTINDANEIAQKHKGECTSREYVNNHADLSWKCIHGHDFFKPLKRVKLGEWCPFCSGKYVALTPSELSKVAENRGGKYLSNKTLKVSENAEWECSNGHRWNALVNNVVNLDSWCPFCKNNTGEEICRLIFQTLTNKEFPTKRPAWLRGANQVRSMELDGFCEELKVAFEHQGKQHYEEGLSHFQSEDVIARDVIKRNICKEHGIEVLEIPQIGHYIQIQDAINLIKGFLMKNNCVIYGDISDDEIKENKFSLYDKNLFELNEIAQSRGGKCLSNTYLGHITPLKFQCKNNHIWLARPNDIKRGSWCSICSGAGGKKKSIESLKTMFLSEGIECLSEAYSNSKGKYTWQCRNGHVFQSRYDSVNGRCPKCV